MFNDIDWTKKGNAGICILNTEKIKEYAKMFSQGHWTFLGPGNEKKWHGTLLYTPEGKWDSTLKWWKGSKIPVIPYSRASVL